jgi:cell division initiation protein
MLTPQEVSEHTFTKASFGSGGYNVARVDEFLDLLTADYTKLYNDNAVLKNKLKVLADKVEEYRSTEEAMRKALLTAQRMADKMVQEAEEKKAAVLREAEEKKATLLQEVEAQAAARNAQLREETALEETKLAAAQKSTSDYLSKVRLIYQQGLEQLDQLNDLVLPAPAAETEAAAPGDSVAETAMDIENTIQKLIADEMAAAAESRTADKGEALYTDPEAPSQEGGNSGEEDQEPTRRIDFDNLQFGQDFEIG